MISCNFNGRLGNNLFQIATVASLANKIGVDFMVPNISHAGHRGDIPVNLSMFGYSFNRGECEVESEYNESTFEYVSIRPKDKLKIGGFFQSWKYFEDIKELLLNKYFIPSEDVIEALSKYTVSDNSLGISIRRGDYLMLQHNHCVLDTTYYQEVLNTYFQDNIDQIFVFSDDLDWCKSVFGSEVIYVQDIVGAQLFLMSKMKHLIMSNSTFAWWGAYLNQNNGIIVAPAPWFGPNNSYINTNDLYYPSWIKFNHIISNQEYSITHNMFN
jgi:hypothetical protein